MSQLQAIERDLRKGHSISAMSASYRYNCWRLAARIAELRAKGMNIKTERMKSQHGNFAKYSIK